MTATLRRPIHAFPHNLIGCRDQALLLIGSRAARAAPNWRASSCARRWPD
jgi:hypothetical protein